jgi:hypothetical protein
MFDSRRLAKSSSDAEVEQAVVRAAGGLRTMLSDTGRRPESFAESISLLLTVARREDKPLLHWFHAAALQLMRQDVLALKAARRYLNLRQPTGKNSDEDATMQQLARALRGQRIRKRIRRRKPHQ